jgi:hypothetical protein
MIINFTKHEIKTSGLYDNNTYFIVDYTPNGYKQLLSYVKEDFFCGTYFVLRFPFSKSFDNPVDYFNANSDEQITPLVDFFYSEHAIYTHENFRAIKITQLTDCSIFPLVYEEDTNTFFYFAKYGFAPLFYPCVFTGHNKLQQKSLLIDGTDEEKAIALHKSFYVGVAEALSAIKSMNPSVGLLPPPNAIKNLTKEMMCQYIELKIPFCHPNMYPFLKLETNVFIRDGKITLVETVDEFMGIWLPLKLASLVPEVQKEKTENEHKEFIYKFLLAITDSTLFVWFVWAPENERNNWVTDNISERAIDVINNIKLGEIAKIAEGVLRHEGVKPERNIMDFKVCKMTDYYINKLKQ